jgi:Ca2+-binding RTX toxin-like protein
MATEVGGQSIGITISPAADPAVIEQFFNEFFSQSIGEPEITASGREVYTTDTGEELSIFRADQDLGTAIKLSRSEDGVISTGNDDTFLGGRGSNKLLITDDADHKVLAGSGNDTIISAGTGDNTLLGGAGNDKLVAGSGSDALNGGSGSDTLIGGKGNSVLNGGTGADRIESGEGDEFMIGGRGPDTFFFKNGSTGDDVILDFKKNDILHIADRNGDGAVNAEGPKADFTITDAGRDTIITFANGDSIKLKNVDADDLEETSQDGIFKLH